MMQKVGGVVYSAGGVVTDVKSYGRQYLAYKIRGVHGKYDQVRVPPVIWPFRPLALPCSLAARCLLNRVLTRRRLYARAGQRSASSSGHRGAATAARLPRGGVLSKQSRRSPKSQLNRPHGLLCHTPRPTSGSSSLPCRPRRCARSTTSCASTSLCCATSCCAAPSCQRCPRQRPCTTSTRASATSCAPTPSPAPAPSRSARRRPAAQPPPPAPSRRPRDAAAGRPPASLDPGPYQL